MAPATQYIAPRQTHMPGYRNILRRRQFGMNDRFLLRARIEISLQHCGIAFGGSRIRTKAAVQQVGAIMAILAREIWKVTPVEIFCENSEGGSSAASLRSILCQ